MDKTKWIERLLTTNKAYFLSRPRRFGKSLTISTLKELFKGNKKLFEDLYIYDKWDFVEYPVIVFDFNKIMNKNSIMSSFVKTKSKFILFQQIKLLQVTFL